MKGRNLAVMAVILSALAATTPAQEQKAPDQRAERRPALQLPLEPVERYNAVLPARRNPALAGARIVLRHWHIANDQQVEIPHEGFLLVHLHSGDILVTVGDKRTERHADEWWTVQPGEKLVVETNRDSVVLRTLDTITRR
jgi:hypothetical protein